MSDAVAIRHYHPQDLDACRHLWRELTEWHRQLYDDPTIGGNHPEDYFNSYLKEMNPDRIWVAVVNTKVVGLTGLQLHGEGAEIEPVVVSTRYQHRGIGRKLIATVIAEARRLHVKSLSIKPVARNIRAIQVFYQLGFQNLGQIEIFIDFSDRKWRKNLRLFNLQFSY